VTKLHQLAELGQAVWLDFLRRSFIESGELQALIDQGVRGMTSNPTIFEKAIDNSDDYDDELHQLVDAGKTVEEIYEALTIGDIKRAADLLYPIYEQTNGADGYVSLEVSPALAHDSAGTIAEAKRLFAALARPNVMIKVPATPEGIPAVRTLIATGVNINITLMFSVAHYIAVAEAYISGLEALRAAGGDVSKIASVASFFVSRVDTAVDAALEKKGNKDLQGKAAVANARVGYAKFQETFGGPRWAALEKHGAHKQRPLWASTGTKNPAYSDTLYIDSLIGPDTVNTVPPATLNAYMNHGSVTPSLRAEDIGNARVIMERLAAAGVDIDAVTEQLQRDAVDIFSKSFEALNKSITEKRDRLLAARYHVSGSLASYQAAVDGALGDMKRDDIIARIWAHDHTVWKPEPSEIVNRLGWLHVAETVSANADQLDALVQGVRADGYTHALLLGMGGSSLAPEVFAQTFGAKSGYLDLSVLDSTDPGAVLAYAERLDPRRTLYIVSTKSGGTVETFSFFRYFYNQTMQAVGSGEAGKHFIAITDPGSALADSAARYGFRATILNNPEIGGRYSALSYFGMVPAALSGVDVRAVLEQAMRAANACGATVPVAENPGAWIGAVMGELAKAGRDKLTFVIAQPLAGFGNWVEQLIAESTGKEGKGIAPVVGESLAGPEAYADDRLFVRIAVEEDPATEAALAALEAAGHPVIRMEVHNRYELGALYFIWEMATAVAGYRLGINAFDQPNVEAAKVLARQMVAAYEREGKLPPSHAQPVSADALREYLAQADAGNPAGRSYVALQAYVQPTQETDAGLRALRTRIQRQFRLATTVGYGPRFLHSTGQLHKGDGGHGLFIQFVADIPRDATIPDEAGKPASSISFGVLKSAQVLGDAQALTEAHRRLIRFDLGAEPAEVLNRLAESLLHL
jgi:transaldolase / glucose-6-phosphate isomerase